MVRSVASSAPVAGTVAEADAPEELVVVPSKPVILKLKAAPAAVPPAASSVKKVKPPAAAIAAVPAAPAVVAVTPEVISMAHQVLCLSGALSIDVLLTKMNTLRGSNGDAPVETAAVVTAVQALEVNGTVMFLDGMCFTV
mgnify:CR=1 FL=1